MTGSCRRSARLAGDADAYTYLPSSVRRFPAPRELAAVMWDCGLRESATSLTAGGIIALHVGEVVRGAEVARNAGVAADADVAGDDESP